MAIESVGPAGGQYQPPPGHSDAFAAALETATEVGATPSGIQALRQDGALVRNAFIIHPAPDRLSLDGLPTAHRLDVIGTIPADDHLTLRYIRPDSPAAGSIGMVSNAARKPATLADRRFLLVNTSFGNEAWTLVRQGRLNITSKVLADMVALQEGSWMSPQLAVAKLELYAAGHPIEDLAGDKFIHEAVTPIASLGDDNFKPDRTSLLSATHQMLNNPDVISVRIAMLMNYTSVMNTRLYTPLNHTPFAERDLLIQRPVMMADDYLVSETGYESNYSYTTVGFKFKLPGTADDAPWADAENGPAIGLPGGSRILLQDNQVKETPGRERGATMAGTEYLEFTLPELTPSGRPVGGGPAATPRGPDRRLASFKFGQQIGQDQGAMAEIRAARETGTPWVRVSPDGEMVAKLVPPYGLFVTGNDVPSAAVTLPDVPLR